MKILRIIFACVHNAGRSQMAAAFYNNLTKSSEGISAGTKPGERVHLQVVTVMKEIGIDLSDAKPQLLTDDLARTADMLVTMGCGESCPLVPGLQREDWPLPDPKDKDLNEVREIRDEIRKRVEQKIDSLKRS